MVIKTEISVPVAKNKPMDETTPELEIKPIKNPAIIKINPLVAIVGKEFLMAPIKACFLSCFSRKVGYL